MQNLTLYSFEIEFGHCCGCSVVSLLWCCLCEMSKVLYHCCGIVGARCLSTISWLVTPGLHSAHVHCNHYHGDGDDDDDDYDDDNDDNEGGAIVVDDGDGCCINRWPANWFSDVDKREVALGRQHSMPASQFDEIRKVLDWVGTKIFLKYSKYSKPVNLTSKVF